MKHSILLMAALSMPLAAAGLSACASMDGEREVLGAARFADVARLGEKVDEICFSRSIDGFGETTRRTVVLTRGVRDDYLVEVFGGCFDLEGAQSIGVDSTGSCLRRGDNLIVSNSPFSLGYSAAQRQGADIRTCRVNAIYKWDKDAADKEDEAKMEDKPAN